MSVLRLRGVRVLDDRVDLIVTVEGHDTPGLSSREAAVERLLAWLPGMVSHRCSTETSRPFIEEMRDTELPHLFEHIVLEVMACAGSPRDVSGHTVWRKGEQAFRVSVYDDDDAVCVSAARAALTLLDSALRDDITVDVDAIIGSVAAARVKPNRHPAAIDPR